MPADELVCCLCPVHVGTIGVIRVICLKSLFPRSLERTVQYLEELGIAFLGVPFLFLVSLLEELGYGDSDEEFNPILTIIWERFALGLAPRGESLVPSDLVILGFNGGIPCLNRGEERSSI